MNAQSKEQEQQQIPQGEIKNRTAADGGDIHLRVVDKPMTAMAPPQKKVPKIKRKKYQSIGHEMISLFTMVMHK